jgi:tetratricopeptide (TPR) repeat protein
MKLFASLRSLVLASGFLCLSTQTVLATCGGGGGGGMGGAAPSSDRERAEPEVYRVPWKICSAGKQLPSEASLLVLWFPSNAAAVRTSDLLTSRSLTQAASRCVADILITPDNKAIFTTYKITPGQETVILASADGTEISRVIANAKDTLEVRAVEKVLKTEIDAREKKLEAMLKIAEAKAKAGDKSALEDLQKVWGGRCLSPSLGKRAAKALKKLGAEVSQIELTPLGADGLADADVTGLHDNVEALLKAGLVAEVAGRFDEAGLLYRQAVDLDPADVTALRFLGEFYRHETGEWDKAGRVFNRILAQPADPIARAVALHGLGKMTIHAGRFKTGLGLFEQSLAAYPLAITYRNLAVYWYSEKQTEKAAGFMRQAIALEPNDRYNQIFAAVYLAAAGHKEEALEIARKNEAVLAASYNLAAIWAQAGDRAKAMDLLRRHFYTYERYDAVRSMEMKEAREDYMFTSLHKDADFANLTALAKNAWMVGQEWCSPDQLLPVTEPPGPRTM